MTLAESEYRQSIFGLLELNYDELHLNGQLGNYRIPLDTSNVQNHYDERLNHKEKIFILKVVFIYQWQNTTTSSLYTSKTWMCIKHLKIQLIGVFFYSFTKNVKCGLFVCFFPHI